MKEASPHNYCTQEAGFRYVYTPLRYKNYAVYVNYGIMMSIKWRSGFYSLLLPSTTQGSTQPLRK
jgi:hypothetical protein